MPPAGRVLAVLLVAGALLPAQGRAPVGEDPAATLKASIDAELEAAFSVLRRRLHRLVDEAFAQRPRMPGEPGVQAVPGGGVGAAGAAATGRGGLGAERLAGLRARLARLEAAGADDSVLDPLRSLLAEVEAGGGSPVAAGERSPGADFHAVVDAALQRTVRRLVNGQGGLVPVAEAPGTEAGEGAPAEAALPASESIGTAVPVSGAFRVLHRLPQGVGMRIVAGPLDPGLRAAGLVVGDIVLRFGSDGPLGSHVEWIEARSGLRRRHTLDP